MFAPKEEKSFVKGVTAYMQGNPSQALQHFRDVMDRDASGAHVGEEYFAAMSLVAMDRDEEAIAPLEVVLASEDSLPDPLMNKYGVGGEMSVQVTPSIEARLPISHAGAALLLAELYQRTGSRDGAIQLLESLGATTPDPIFALSLAELYTEGSRWNEVIRVSEGFENKDDATCQLITARANALYELEMFEACLAATKEALRSKKRLPLTLRLARYLKASALQATGKKALARREFERLYAEDSTFLDVGERLGVAKPDSNLPLPP